MLYEGVSAMMETLDEWRVRRCAAAARADGLADAGAARGVAGNVRS